MKQSNNSNLILCLAVFMLLALLLYALPYFFTDIKTIIAELNEFGKHGKLLFWGIAALAGTISVPRQIIALSAGLAFGWLTELALCAPAVLFGNIVQFYISRWLLRPFLQNKAEIITNKLDTFASLGEFRVILFLRLLPAGHSGIINLAAGASHVNFLPFLGASFLGQLPQNCMFTLLGSGVLLGNIFIFSVSAVLFVISFALGLYLYRYYKHGLLKN